MCVLELIFFKQNGIGNNMCFLFVWGLFVWGVFVWVLVWGVLVCACLGCACVCVIVFASCGWGVCFAVCKEWKAAETAEISRRWGEWEANFHETHAVQLEEQVKREVWEEIEILFARRREAISSGPSSRSAPY